MDLRAQRMGLIQTPDQLRFSYLAILEGSKKMFNLQNGGSGGSPSQANHNNESSSSVSSSTTSSVPHKKKALSLKRSFGVDEEVLSIPRSPLAIHSATPPPLTPNSAIEPSPQPAAVASVGRCDTLPPSPPRVQPCHNPLTLVTRSAPQHRPVPLSLGSSSEEMLDDDDDNDDPHRHLPRYTNGISSTETNGHDHHSDHDDSENDHLNGCGTSHSTNTSSNSVTATATNSSSPATSSADSSSSTNTGTISPENAPSDRDRTSPTPRDLANQRRLETIQRIKRKQKEMEERLKSNEKYLSYAKKAALGLALVVCVGAYLWVHNRADSSLAVAFDSISSTDGGGGGGSAGATPSNT